MIKDELDKIKKKEDELYLKDNYIPSKKPIFYLSTLVLTSVFVLLFLNARAGQETVSRVDANLEIMRDIQQLPQVPRAKRAARALTDLAFDIAEKFQKNELAPQTVKVLTTVTAKKLYDTGEDNELANSIKHIKALPEGGYSAN